MADNAAKKKEEPTLEQLRDQIDLPPRDKRKVDIFVSLDLEANGINRRNDLANFVRNDLLAQAAAGELADTVETLPALRGLPLSSGGVDNGKAILWELANKARTAGEGVQSVWSCAVADQDCYKQPTTLAEVRAALRAQKPEDKTPATINANRGISITTRSAPLIGFMNGMVNGEKLAPNGVDAALQSLATQGVTGESIVTAFHNCQRANPNQPTKGLDVPECNKAGGRLSLIFKKTYPGVQYDGSTFTGTPTMIQVAGAPVAEAKKIR